jgi:hypothetical protein
MFKTIKNLVYVASLIFLTISCDSNNKCENDDECKKDKKCINNKCLNPIEYSEKQIKKIKFESARHDELMKKLKQTHPLSQKQSTERFYELISNTMSLSYNEETQAIESDNFKRAEKVRKARNYAYGAMFKYLNFVREINIENESKTENKRKLETSALEIIELTIKIYGKEEIDDYIVKMDEINKEVEDLEILMTIDELENFKPKWIF